MTFKTHLTGGILVSTLCCTTIGSAALVVIGSLLPDIDHSGSALGKTVPFVSKLFKHRGITHSLLMLIICWFLLSPYIAIGVASHILLDMLTKQGVKLLWPLPISIKFFPIANLIRTGGVFEKLLFASMWLFVLVRLGLMWTGVATFDTISIDSLTI